MREKRGAYLALRKIEDSLGNYLGAITVINAGLGLAVGLAMWAWGMPGAILFGVGAFILNYIPYLGAIVGVAISGWSLFSSCRDCSGRRWSRVRT